MNVPRLQFRGMGQNAFSINVKFRGMGSLRKQTVKLKANFLHASLIGLYALMPKVMSLCIDEKFDLGY